MIDCNGLEWSDRYQQGKYVALTKFLKFPKHEEKMSTLWAFSDAQEFPAQESFFDTRAFGLTGAN